MSKKSHPNILILISDQQQQSTMTDSSACIMPNVAKLRKSGVTFTEARSVNAVCSPARASLMTGLLPHNHGMVDNSHCVEEFRANFQSDRPTLPGQLKDHGYQLGYFGKWHVDRGGDPGAFGFDRFETEHHDKIFHRTLKTSYTVNHNGYNERTLYGVHEEPVSETEEYFFYSEGIDFIRRATAESSAPWCTFISSNAPHDPYLAPAELYKLYDPAALELPASFSDEMTDKPNIYRRIQAVWKDLEPENFREAMACYYANCTMVDLQVGRVLALLEETGQLDNTIVVFMSDHGDLMGSHGLLCKGVPAFDEGYRVPLVVSYPGQIDPGTEYSGYASTIDIAPTILELSGCLPIPGTDGRSLMLSLAMTTASQSCYAEFFGQRLSYSQRIVWMDDFKYVFNGFDFDELYDLKSDPGEVTNLIDDPAHKQKAQELCREMWRWAKTSGDKSLLESEYFMFRFAPVGPEREKEESIYNRGA